MIVVGVLPIVLVDIVLAVDEAADEDETGGRVGADADGATGGGPTSPPGDDAIIGLTPRLPISVDPIGIPVRAAPPSVVGDVDVGVEDEEMLLEPEPHIPDVPAVSIIPDVVDIPEVANTPDDVDIADGVDIPDVTAVAGAVVPTAIPPPS